MEEKWFTDHPPSERCPSHPGEPIWAKLRIRQLHNERMAIRVNSNRFL